MLTVLIATTEESSFDLFRRGLEAGGASRIDWAKSGRAALDRLAENPVDLAVADEELGDMTAMEFASRLLMVNPMINCALVSALSEEDFHEAGEGLGVLAKLPKNPGREDAENIMTKLKKIMAIELDSKG